MVNQNQHDKTRKQITISKIAIFTAVKDAVIFVSFCFNTPVNKCSVKSVQSHYFQGINQYFGKLMCLAQGEKALEGMELATF